MCRGVWTQGPSADGRSQVEPINFFAQEKIRCIDTLYSVTSVLEIQFDRSSVYGEAAEVDSSTLGHCLTDQCCAGAQLLPY